MKTKEEIDTLINLSREDKGYTFEDDLIIQLEKCESLSKSLKKAFNNNEEVEVNRLYAELEYAVKNRYESVEGWCLNNTRRKR